MLVGVVFCLFEGEIGRIYTGKREKEQKKDGMRLDDTNWSTPVEYYYCLVLSPE